MLGILAALVAPCAASSYMDTALDQYVALEDSNYRYELYENQTIRGEHWTGYVVSMCTPSRVCSPFGHGISEREIF